MRKYILTIVLGLALAGAFASYVMASDITSARYIGTVRVSNNSTASSNVSTVFTLDTQTLLDFNFMDDSTDVVTVANAGGDVAFMPGWSTNPWVTYVPLIGDYGNLDYRIYMGDVSGGKIRYFPGSGGMNLGDPANMEASANFSLETSVFFNAVTSGDIIRKGFAFEITADGAGSITVKIPAMVFNSDSHPEVTSVDGRVFHLLANQAWATIRDGAGTGAEDGAVPLSVQIKSGAGASQWNQIYRSPVLFDTSILPDGCTITSANLTIYGHSKGDDYAPAIALDMNVYACTPASDTVLVSTDYNISNWGGTPFCDTPITYANFQVSGGANDFSLNAAGLAAISKTGITKFGIMNANYDAADSPPVWSASKDAYLFAGTADWYAPPVLTVIYTPCPTATVSGIESGDRTIRAYQDGTDLGLIIDEGLGSEVSDIDAGGALAVVDTAADWVVCGSDATINLEYYKHEVGGVERCNIEWEYAATFSDLSGNGNSATPTFRTATSDADVTASLLNFSPASQAQASASSLSYEGELIDEVPDEPSTMYTSSDDPGFFLAPLINEFLDAGEVPRSLFWYPFAYLCVIAMGALTFRITKSLLVQAALMMGLLIFFCLPGLNILGMWTVIFFGFEAVGIIIMSKHFAW